PDGPCLSARSVSLGRGRTPCPAAGDGCVASPKTSTVAGPRPKRADDTPADRNLKPLAASRGLTRSAEPACRPGRNPPAAPPDGRGTGRRTFGRTPTGPPPCGRPGGIPGNSPG